jgi:hypothetical protein
MAKKKDQKVNDPNQGVMFKAKDAQRMANVVHWFESTPRPRNPSKLPRAPGGGGGGIRLCQFTGDWTNEPGQSGLDNVKLVTLYKRNPASTAPNAWIPEEGSPAVALNLMSYIPTPRGGPISMWGAVTPVGTITGNDGNSYTLWLLISAQC